MLEIHLESHRLPARLIAQHTMRIADVPENEHREDDEQKRKPAKALPARQKAFNVFRYERGIDDDTRHEQKERQEDGVVPPLDIPVARIRHR